MDPNATVQLIIEAIRTGDADGLADACEDLARWLRAGGFPPDADSVARAYSIPA